MEIKYYQKWVRLKKSPAMPLTAQEAKHRHDARQPYVAVLSEAEKPLYIVNLASDWVSIYFLDDLSRIYLSYDFRELRKDEVFLTGAIHRQFDGKSEKITSSITFKFQPTGEILMERRDHLNSVVEEKETTAESCSNWERFPDFGGYAALCKVNRE